MVKAAALYVVIVIALVIGLICSLLIGAAAFYRLDTLKRLRYEKLTANLASAVSISLASAGEQELQKLDLFGTGTDSIFSERIAWGVYTLCKTGSFVPGDTLQRVFLAGPVLATDAPAFTLADEDRPLSISGDARIRGNALLPKSGIRKAYADGKGFTGNEPVEGKIGESRRTLPAPDNAIVASLENALAERTAETDFPQGDFVRSFFGPAKRFFLRGKKNRLGGVRLSGNIEVHCDTLLEIDADCTLENVVLYAPAIRVAEGFRGTCQLFATDSIVIGKRAEFGYPSCAAVLKRKDAGFQARVSLGEKCRFSGIIFTWEPSRSPLQTMIELQSETVVAGELYATGFAKVAKKCRVEGSIACHRLVMKTPSTLYENFLIDVTVDRHALSRYYTGSPLFARPGKPAIISWLK